MSADQPDGTTITEHEAGQLERANALTPGWPDGPETAAQANATIGDGAAKAALVNLTKSLAQEFGPRGIRVDAVSPGPVATDRWLGEHGVAENVAKATGVDAATGRKTIIAGTGGFATG